MNEDKTIYHFLVDQEIDYVDCPIDILLEAIEAYFHYVEDENLFSDQMLLLSEGVEENRNGFDAIRLNMKSLDLLSPLPIVQEVLVPEPKSDI